MTDAFGNLVRVVEPNPDVGADLETNYTYDMFNRVIGVSMTRNANGTPATQTRTWTYDATTRRLISKTEPETGTTSYVWNADGTLQSKRHLVGDTTVEYVDSMGRLVQVPGGTLAYGPADEITDINYSTLTEHRSYNLLGQLTKQRGVGNGTMLYEFAYGYTDGANNGQIASFTDKTIGEQAADTEVVNYTYDSLRRLIRAETGETGPQWGEAMTYDGFGNLLSENPTKGTAPSYNFTVNGTNNRIQNIGWSYDGNGNVTSTPLQSGTSYYVENRMKQADASSPTYRYGGDGQWVMRGSLVNNQIYYEVAANTDATLHIRDPFGRLRYVVRYRDNNPGASEWTILNSYDYFVGHMIVPAGSPDTTTWYATDRLGSVRARVGRYLTTWFVDKRYSYFPYGQERGTESPNDTFKFATYWREGVLDDAQQRWYGSKWGRFMTADPSSHNLNLADSISLNRTAYANGDPINRSDPTGLGSGMCIDGDRDVYGNCQGTGPYVPGPSLDYVDRIGEYQYVSEISFPGYASGDAVATSPSAMSQITSALQIMMTLLDEQCKKFLASGQDMQSLEEYLRQISASQTIEGNEQIGPRELGPGTNARTEYPGDGYPIAIGTSGAFFSPNAGVGYAKRHAGDMAELQGGSPGAQVFILLHEFAHYFNVPGFVMDGGTRSLQEANNDLLWDNCDKTIQKAKRYNVL